MSMDEFVPVKLSDHDREERHASILHHLGEAERLEAKKRDDSKATQALIDHEWAECYRLRRVLLDDQENRRQGDLFVSDEVAVSALAEVAKAAEKLPTEPHEFVIGSISEGRPDLCELCGADPLDPVHNGGDLLPHVFSPAYSDSGERESLDCTFQGCGLQEGHMLHDVAGGQRPEPVDAPRAQDAAPAAPCGACASHLCRVHPHAFNPDPEHGGDRCTCGFGKRAKVHREEVEEPAAAAPVDPAYNFGPDEPPPAPAEARG